MLKDLTREQQLIILGLVFVLVAGLGVMTFRRLSPATSEELSIDPPPAQTEAHFQKAGLIVVHVAGAVKQEGVYRLKFGDRVMDAINLAGGAVSSANLSSINLAEKVKDGQKIIVPEKVKIAQRRSGDPMIRGSGTSSGKININAASEKELCKVQGIGPATAKKIVEHRSQNGPFTKIEDIMKVKGIGKGKFGKIKEEITI